MTSYRKNQRAQSRADTAASIIQAELVEYGVQLPRYHLFNLQQFVAQYGAEDVRTIAMKALDRWSEGINDVQGKTAEDYIMERLKRHNRGNNR